MCKVFTRETSVPRRAPVVKISWGAKPKPRVLNSGHPHLDLSVEKNTFEYQADSEFMSYLVLSIMCAVGKTFN